ncbi:MAG: UDP-N-acetylglucosamine 1-carboxyvinyltransferase [Bacilli bacterium]|jgi:UDP-N-acetylglucosamine 1-carboxyvinyltransferase|nr:UDP-N-acetylglucosamine 1-carboxyvinyltransferase [Bacilli bacterium]
MKQMIIEGNNILSGTIEIGGAKNSAVALIPASILANGASVIENVPNISDRDALLDILNILNCESNLEQDKLTIDTTKLKNAVIEESLSSRMRASYYFMGALLGREKFVEIYIPGGCNIGTRPIDIHLDGFRALGANITIEGNKYTLKADKLQGTDIYLKFPSVGATINIMFAAVLAEGTTIIHNAAKEIEIVNIADYLITMGANIKGAGTDEIIITGVPKLQGGKISVLPDRIEAGTYIILGALCGKDLKINNIIPEHLEALTSKLQEMGVDLIINKDNIIINKVNELKPINIKTLIYPGFPTDIGQPMSVLLTQGNGKSLFEETIWENRMGHVPSLNKMGANIKVNGMNAIIEGPTRLKGCEVVATDLRGGAALVLAGLTAEGTTIITDVEHILRGYENIEEKLTNIGAKIELKEI